MNEKTHRRLETRLKPGQSFKLINGQTVTNIGEKTAKLMVMTPVPTGEPNESKSQPK